MCNSLASNLLKPGFADAALDLAEKAGGLHTLPRMMCDGLAANLLKPGFADAALDLAKKAGGIHTLPQMMCDSLAANLLKPGFTEAAFKVARRAGGVDQLPALMCNGLAARLFISDFTTDLHAILDIAEELSVDVPMTLARLVKQDSEFLDYVSSIRNRLELRNDDERRECLRGLAGDRSKKRKAINGGASSLPTTSRCTASPRPPRAAVASASARPPEAGRAAASAPSRSGRRASLWRFRATAATKK
jgi:hypothetical protein